MRIQLLTGLFLILCGQPLKAQRPMVQVLDSGKATNLRGLSSTDGQHLWVSGNGGWIGRTSDGGRTWSWMQPLSASERDFRDIQALTATTAVTLAIDTPAFLLKTTDGGRSWEQVYYNGTPGMFLDALDFSDQHNGIVVGDPIAGEIFLARTTDGGNSWQPFLANFKDSVLEGEAFFAASGTNIHLMNSGDFLLPSGGAASRFWDSRRKDLGHSRLPFRQGIATAGPNGMDVKGDMIAIVGGDFTRPSQGDSSFALSYDGGKHWEKQHQLPGYGSAVAIISPDSLVASGLTGVWLTKDAGKTWTTIDERPFNSLLFIPATRKLFLAGPRGTVAVIEGL